MLCGRLLGGRRRVSGDFDVLDPVVGHGAFVFAVGDDDLGGDGIAHRELVELSKAFLILYGMAMAPMKPGMASPSMTADWFGLSRETMRPLKG
jgi:hypothetical protein